jgi:hypothetical protein
VKWSYSNLFHGIPYGNYQNLSLCNWYCPWLLKHGLTQAPKSEPEGKHPCILNHAIVLHIVQTDLEDELTCYDTQANIQTQECMTIVVPVETLDISVSLCVVSGMNTECVNCCHQVHFNIFISKGVIYRLTFQR